MESQIYQRVSAFLNNAHGEHELLRVSQKMMKDTTTFCLYGAVLRANLFLLVR